MADLFKETLPGLRLEPVHAQMYTRSTTRAMLRQAIKDIDDPTILSLLDTHVQRKGKSNTLQVRWNDLGVDNINVHSVFTQLLLNPGNITVLDLSNNSMRSCEMEWVFGMERLEELSLSDNRLESLGHDQGEVGTYRDGQLSSLRVVSIANNLFVSLPSWIYKLPALQELNAQGNHLTMVHFRSFVSGGLISVNLSNNSLSTFPRHVTENTQLEVLRLAHNDIADVPKCKWECHALSILDLSNNKLRSSKWLRQLHVFDSFSSLNLQGNPQLLINGEDLNMRHIDLLNVDGCHQDCLSRMLNGNPFVVTSLFSSAAQRRFFPPAVRDKEDQTLHAKYFQTLQVAQNRVVYVCTNVYICMCVCVDMCMCVYMCVCACLVFFSFSFFTL